MYRFIIFPILSLLSLSIHSQTPVNGEKYNGVYLLETVIIDGDTIPVVTLRPTTISANRKARSKRYQRKRSKLYRNVIKTYPYAKVAGTLIKEYNRNLSLLDTEAARDAYLDKCEEDLKAEFEDDLNHMTMSQGRVLIKLIDRETGNTSYELIKELKNGFTAFMWQGVARLFGTDLKANFDPDNDETDYIIEEVVQKIESGEIPVDLREVQTREAREILEAKDKRLQRRIERERKKQERRK
jgi:hypothetical protein